MKVAHKSGSDAPPRYVQLFFDMRYRSALPVSGARTVRPEVLMAGSAGEALEAMAKAVPDVFNGLCED
jgi:hypothetical protein